MKRYLRILLVLLTLSMAPVTLLYTGCTTSQQTIAYNTLSSVGLSVNSAYAAYNDKVVAGTATFSPTVAKAYNDFQAVFNVAVVAASTNPNAVAPQNVVDAANAVYAAVKQFTK